MTPTRDELVNEAALRGKDRNSRRLLMLLGTVLTISILALLISGYLLWVKKQDQALAGKDLAIQVQQACESPVTAEHLGSICKQAKAVEKQITAGPQGPPGINGRDGRDGTDGTNGIDGQQGLPGTNGINGKDGRDGAPGPVGATGTAGKDGSPGKDGANGVDGKNGTDGKDGRGIASVSCDGSVPLQSFTIFYTDGTTQQVDCSKP